MESIPNNGLNNAPLFLSGEYDALLDDKNRLLVPADFRKEIALIKEEKTLICKIGRKRVPWLYPEFHYRQLIAERRSTLLPGDDEEAFNETHFGMIFKLPVDAQGRIVLPEKLIKRANLSRNLTIVGAGDHIAIRNREDWEKRAEQLLDEQDEAADRERMPREAGRQAELPGANIS